MRDVLSSSPPSNARAIRRSLSFATARVKTRGRCTRSVASAAHPSNAGLKRRELKRRTHRSKRWRRRARAVVSSAHAAKAGILRALREADDRAAELLAPNERLARRRFPRRESAVLHSLSHSGERLGERPVAPPFLGDSLAPFRKRAEKDALVNRRGEATHDEQPLRPLALILDHLLPVEERRGQLAARVTRATTRRARTRCLRDSVARSRHDANAANCARRVIRDKHTARRRRRDRRSTVTCDHRENAALRRKLSHARTKRSVLRTTRQRACSASARACRRRRGGATRRNPPRS